MRTINFIVEGQIISLDPQIDCADLVPGSEGYLRASFTFSPEWDGCEKVAGFYSLLGKEYAPQVLNDGKTCLIPSDALKKRIFKVQLLGKKQNLKLTTNKVVVRQNGGKK